MATFGLLMLAVVIALVKGSVVGAVVLGILAIPPLIFIVAWLYAYVRAGRS
jgi:hypothetical protein